MLPCYSCAYRDTIPGDAHSACSFDWLNADPEVRAAFPTNVKGGPRTDHWFLFPLNFDPVWGPDTCKAHAAERDPAKARTPDPFAFLLSLLGGQG